MAGQGSNAGTPSASTTQKEQKSVFREYTEALLVALLLALFIRSFIVQAFKIPSGSMLSTLQIGDHILVSKFAYGLRLPYPFDTLVFEWGKPERDDVIVFVYPKDETKDFIKRVVAVEGGNKFVGRGPNLLLSRRGRLRAGLALSFFLVVLRVCRRGANARHSEQHYEGER